MSTQLQKLACRTRTAPLHTVVNGNQEMVDVITEAVCEITEIQFLHVCTIIIDNIQRITTMDSQWIIKW